MNKEIILILMMICGGGLWALGGTQISDKIKGQLWLRRYLLPLVMFGLLFWYGINWIQALVAGSLLCGVTHLPYGKTTPYWAKLLVGFSYTLPAVVIGITWWMLLLPLIFITTFYLSNLSWTRKDFAWKVCEFITGATIAICIIGALHRPWMA